MYRYRAYNLSIRSDIELPDLTVHVPASEAEADLSIRLTSLDPRSFHGDNGSHSSSTDGVIALDLRMEGRFLFREGREILIDPNPELDEPSLRLFMLGAGLNIALYQRGLWVFHAGVVAVRGNAVAFLGAQHAGKTTTVAALVERGHPLISDDLLALEIGPDGPKAIPSFPRFKIWPDSAEALGIPFDGLPKVKPDIEKRTLRSADERFSSGTFPLERLYLLQTGQEIRIERLTPKEAQLELMPHWDLSKFGLPFLKGKRLAVCFAQCGDLAKRARVSRLTRTASLSDLPRLVDRVEQDLECPSQA